MSLLLLVVHVEKLDMEWTAWRWPWIEPIDKQQQQQQQRPVWMTQTTLDNDLIAISTHVYRYIDTAAVSAS